MGVISKVRHLDLMISSGRHGKTPTLVLSDYEECDRDAAVKSSIS